MKKKGQIVILFTVLFALFIMALAWLVFDHPLKTINNDLEKFNSTNTTQSYQTRQQIMTTWDKWPVYAMVLIMIAGIIAATRKDSYVEMR